MVQFYPLLASCAILLTVSVAPTAVPIEGTSQALSISKDGKAISIGGRTINHSHNAETVQSCSGGKGGRKGGGNRASAPTNAKAIYFITNAAQNSIVALKVAADGTLSEGSITATGGAGMTGVNAEGTPAVPDGLFSQGAIKVAGQVSGIVWSITITNLFRIWSLSIRDQTLSLCLPSTRQTQQS